MKIEWNSLRSLSNVTRKALGAECVCMELDVPHVSLLIHQLIVLFLLGSFLTRRSFAYSSLDGKEFILRPQKKNTAYDSSDHEKSLFFILKRSIDDYNYT